MNLLRRILTAFTVCLSITALANGNPFIESLTGNISGNTLTLTATMNYDNIENQIFETVKYHWKKGEEVQDGNHNVFTDNSAFTPEDITWEVYATYTYEGQEKKTETVTYVQKRPDVTVTGSVSDFQLTLTPTLNTCGVAVNSVQYYLLESESDETVGTPFNPSTDKKDAINFEGKTWIVYATFEYNGNTYRSSCGKYIQEASSLPLLSVIKNEQHEQSQDQLVMTASLEHSYGDRITGISYHWSKNGGAEENEHGNTITSQHSFATQNWSCYATFVYNGQTYTTNTETYTYYSTLGHVMVYIEEVGDKYKAVLYHANEQDQPIGEPIELQSGVTAAYEWKHNKQPATPFATTQEVAKPTVAGVVWVECKVTITDSNGESLEKYRVKLIDDNAQCVVFLDPSSGNDSNTGFESTLPVKSWTAAYQRLPKGGTWDNNIIVVKSGEISLFITEDIAKGVPATITGVWPWDNVTADNVKNGGKLSLNGTTTHPSTTRIGADTKFKYVAFSKSGYVCMYLHDLTFDVGCMMLDMGVLTTNNGALKVGTKTYKAPDMQVFMFANTYNFTTNTTDGGWPVQTKPVTLTIKSGKFGRILSNRITGTTDALIKQRYVIGNPQHPLMAKVNVEIDPATSTGSWNPNNYEHDIAFLCAGMTQGSEYCDVQFNIKRGTIATLVGAMQGNSITNTAAAGLSNSSFFGRTITNINPTNNEDVTIYRYYATCFGRYSDGQTGISNAAFYGQSILKMSGGKIESGAYVSAGGICGLKSDDGKYHTTDRFIPYIDNTASKNYPFMGIKYQPYDAGKTIAKVISNMYSEGEEIDLEKTITQINITGGTIEGGVFGGGYGSSPEMPAANAMAGAGSLWGNTEVNISGGTIKGGIYGGGAGTTEYYDKAPAGRKADFLTVATVYGNTNVTITGTPDIQGNIYGGGAGIEATEKGEFLDIARVHGSTNVTFNADYTEANPFKGNIYGGGAHGGVEGNTNVMIKKGVIVGNVFGGSQGQEGYSNKAKVIGTTKVVIGKE